MLLATAACNFSTSQLQKVVRSWRVLYIFTSKCASRYSGVQFFHIATSKSGPEMTCFVHFDFKMCFSLQRRAIFPHRNFKKWSGADVFCTFSLQNVLLATAACNFWFLLWPHDSAPAALASLLFDSPDTRIIGKTQHFATSLTFGADESSFFWLSRYCIFFLLTLLHLLTLLSCGFTSSICFSSAFQLSILSEVYYLNFLRRANVSSAKIDVKCCQVISCAKHLTILLGFLTHRCKCSAQGPSASSAENEQCAMGTTTCVGCDCDPPS